MSDSIDMEIYRYRYGGHRIRHDNRTIIVNGDRMPRQGSGYRDFKSLVLSSVDKQYLNLGCQVQCDGATGKNCPKSVSDVL